jgi:hypothetical protein
VPKNNPYNYKSISSLVAVSADVSMPSGTRSVSYDDKISFWGGNKLLQFLIICYRSNLYPLLPTHKSIDAKY